MTIVDDKVMSIIAPLELAGLLPKMTEAERAQAAAVCTRMRNATPARGGDRVAILRELGWEHGVCYRLDTLYMIAIWTITGNAAELWATMPRRGRPKKTTTGDI